MQVKHLFEVIAVQVLQLVSHGLHYFLLSLIISKAKPKGLHSTHSNSPIPVQSTQLDGHTSQTFDIIKSASHI